MLPAIEHVVASFARNAVPDARLLVKLHPLDDGLVDWGRIVRRTAAQFGVAERVIAIDGGMGIMGNGTFSNMMAYSEDDWRRIREQIQSTNAADRAKRG